MDKSHAVSRAALLLAVAALPAIALGQDPQAAPQQVPPAGAAAPAVEAPPVAEEVVEDIADVDTIGEIVIVGRRDRNLQQATNVVLSVLSA